MKSTITQARRLWDGWKRVARKIGNFQARVILMVFYAVIFCPFALMVRWGSDPLAIKARAGLDAKTSQPRYTPGTGKEAVLSHVLGISCYFHDSAAALLREGQLVAAAEEERFTRKKHDYEFPQQAIDFCLKTAGIRGADLECVVFFEKPLVKFERLLLSSMQCFPRSHRVFREAMIAWLGDKLWIKSLIQKKLEIPRSKIFFSEHHLSHAASAFFCSPFEEAAILTIDGVGEWTTTAIGVGKGNQVKLLEEMRFPHSLGLLYSAFTAFLGFEVNEGEYKVMGMAPFGIPRYVDKVRQLIRLDRDGSFELNMEYFSFHHSTEATFNREFVRLFGQPRDPRCHFFTPSTGYPLYFGPKGANHDEVGRRNQYYADVAASIQAVTEEAILAMANRAYRQTGMKRLCLAGGVALNSVANGRVMRETPFEEIYVQPAAGDGGGALGAALFGYHMLLGGKQKFVMEHGYWGKQYPDNEIEQFLAQSGIKCERFENDDLLLDRVVDSLQAGKVVGWYQGPFEWGPRALGNRSILADPRRSDMKDIVNTKIKFREPYRPFAPSVLVERAEDFFDLPQAERHYPARFMLYVVDVKPSQREAVPAITHVDGTGRVQTVDRAVAPRYYKLIERFGQATGIPLLLNTSFNLRGEPIVNTPGEAYRTFRASEMDLLILNRHLVTRN